MNKKETRLNQLAEEVRHQKSMKISDIVERFHVSESTARRMCIDLESRGEVVRSFGGIHYLPDDSTYSFDSLTRQNVEEKILIGTYAASVVADGDVLFLSGGTSVYQCAIKISERLSKGQLKNVQIMTNSVANAEVLAEVTRVVLTGGEYRLERRDVAGLLAETNIARSRFSKAFVGVDGIDIEDGLMTLDIDTANSDRLIAERSKIVYVLADSQKFLKKTFISYQNIKTNYVVVTDSNLSSQILEKATMKKIVIKTV